MDQIDNTMSRAYAQQHHDLSFRYSMNHANQFLQHSTEEDTSDMPSLVVEEDENEPIANSFVYKKRVRTKFTAEQLDILEATFQQHRYPTVGVVDDLVEQLGLPTQKITVWFQNRRARLKKTQQKLDNQPSSEKENQQQYDSGIHLDEDVSHESSVSPPVHSLPHLPPPPSSLLMTTVPSSYYLPNAHIPFYNPMWSNFHYPLSAPSFQPSMNLMPYDSSDIPSPFIFQDVGNYHYQKDFHDEL